MAGLGDPERIRVLLLGLSPLASDFTNHLSEGTPGIDLTMTSQREEIWNLLPRGFDCLIIEENAPHVDGVKIAKTIRNKGITHIPIILHNSAKRATRRNAKVGGKVFLDDFNGDEGAARLGALIRAIGKVTSPLTDDKKRGISAPIGD